VEPDIKTTPVEPPRGIHDARVDEKGRLKLPGNFQDFLNGLGEKKVFITSLDSRTARIYPTSVWKENEKLLAESIDDPESAEDIAFMANELGDDSELDAQGRVLINTKLRRLLSLESQPVWLECYQGGINIYNKEVYEERQRRSRENLAAKLAAFKKKGLR
jgi:MraZ protein